MRCVWWGTLTEDCERDRRRLLAVGNAVGAGIGVWECLWNKVRAGVLRGRGVTPLRLKRLTVGGQGGRGSNQRWERHAAPQHPHPRRPDLRPDGQCPPSSLR